MVVVEKLPLSIDFSHAPRGPGAAASSFRALSACEATDCLLDLPLDELKIAARVAPPEVVYPPPDPRIDDALHHPDYRPVQALAHRHLESSKELGSLLLPWPREHHLLPRRLLAVRPAEGVSQKVEGLSGAEVDDARLLLVDGQVELSQLL